MARRYYSSRTKPKNLSLQDLHWKLQNLYLLYRNKDYFKSKCGITERDLPKSIKHEAAVALTFQPFPMSEWMEDDITEDRIFDTIEFLFDRVSKPGVLVDMETESGYRYTDYDKYDDVKGQEEFRETVNLFLFDYAEGFELTADGNIVAVGESGLKELFKAEIPSYDEKNVDSKVRNAIAKWRDRRSSSEDKKEAVRELADVFEWLRKSKKLEKALNRKDESALFDIANNFGIRHHDPKQKTDYDVTIWHAWMFHYYLATYHAAIRILLRSEGRAAKALRSTK